MLKEIKIIDSDFFTDLTQIKLNEDSYDLHNDFICVKIEYLKTEDSLIFIFKNIVDLKIIKVLFHKIVFNIINFDFTTEEQPLTIDLLYRGRFESNGELIDVNKNNQGYIYCDFVNEQKLEFWAESVSYDFKDKENVIKFHK